jgi:uroporphyrinogen decarboxylase
MNTITARERVTGAVRGAALNRPPFSVWRHFYPTENQGAAALAAATIEWTTRFGLDLVKYNPRAHYHAEPWGTRYRYGGAEPPTLERYAVTSADGWQQIRRKGLAEPAFTELLDGLRAVRRRLPDVPLLATVFTPLGVCERLAGRERVRTDLRGRPDDVLGALDAIADTFCDVVRACCDVADGIFYATTSWAQRDLLDDALFERFARPYDLRVLNAAAGAPLNLLHICGPRARVLDLAVAYPGVAAVSWDPHLDGNPSLGAFRAAVPERAAVGGISNRALLASDPSDARADAASGLAATGGRRWIVAGGCTIPPESRPANIAAAQAALLP